MSLSKIFQHQAVISTGFFFVLPLPCSEPKIYTVCTAFVHGHSEKYQKFPGGPVNTVLLIT